LSSTAGCGWIAAWAIKMRILGIVALGASLAGCARQPEYYEPPRKPVSEMTPVERCANLLELSGNAYLNPGQRSAAYEKARNDGCMGQPQPQTIIVR
jgi:hypothetical protein